MKLYEDLRENDLANLISSYISIDEYTSKIDEDNITVALFVNELDAAVQAWSNVESESQYYYEEAKHQKCCVNNADDLPTVEPYLTVPAECLHCAPETVREVEPDCNEPYDVKHNVNRISESVLDVSETISRIVCNTHSCELGKHHVVPEVEHVKSKSEQYDDAQYEHVL